MHTKYLLALGLTTCLTAPASAETWYEMGRSGDVIAHADADSVKREGNLASINELSSHEYGDFHLSTLQFDCGAQRYRALSVANIGSNRQYLSTPDFDKNWVALTPAMAKHKSFACDGGERSTRVADPYANSDGFWDYLMSYDYEDE